MSMREQRGRTVARPQKKILDTGLRRASRMSGRPVAVATAAALTLSGWAAIAAQAAQGDEVSQLGDLMPGARHSYPSDLYDAAGTLYFAATTKAHGNELWKSDGSSTGTVMVTDLVPGTAGSSPDPLGHIGSTLFFGVKDVDDIYHLWKTDGTAAGTEQLVELYDWGSETVQLNGSLFFTANLGSRDELWKSDGTAAGTAMVKEIYPDHGSDPYDLTAMNGTLYFGAESEDEGEELWKSDGTESGTTLVKDIDPGASGSSPEDLTSVGDKFFFTAYDPVHHDALWMSDGTEAGTTMVRDFDASQLNLRAAVPKSLTDVNGTLFFSVNDGTSGTELWKSDGTDDGTELVRDIAPLTIVDGKAQLRDSSPEDLVNANGTLFFTARDADGYGIWTSDGTESGTTRVIRTPEGRANDLTVSNGELFFTREEDGATDLWKISSETAVRLSHFEAEEDRAPEELTVSGNVLFFRASNGTTGLELWRAGADPTAPATSPLPTPLPTVTITATPTPAPTVTLTPQPAPTVMIPGATVTVTVRPTASARPTATAKEDAPKEKTKAPTTTRAKVKVNHKKRTALITTAISPRATGSVAFTLTRGKKTLGRTAARLNSKGNATLRLAPKHLKTKGTYRVKITYAGNSKHAGSSTTTKFKIASTR